MKQPWLRIQDKGISSTPQSRPKIHKSVHICNSLAKLMIKKEKPRPGRGERPSSRCSISGPPSSPGSNPRLSKDGVQSQIRISLKLAPAHASSREFFNHSGSRRGSPHICWQSTDTVGRKTSVIHPARKITDMHVEKTLIHGSLRDLQLLSRRE